MDIDEANKQLDLMIRSSATQIGLTNLSLENAIDAADRIYARNVSQTLVNSAAAILADPTSATQ